MGEPEEKEKGKSRGEKREKKKGYILFKAEMHLRQRTFIPFSLRKKKFLPIERDGVSAKK